MNDASLVTALAVVPALLGVGCASATGPAIVEPVAAVRAQTEVPEAQLLDVGVEVFDPGLPDEDPKALQEKGIYPEVRRSESRYMAFMLKQALQSTGFWGAVRVVPPGTDGVDLSVSTTILKSNGKDLELEVRAVDARGHEWLEERFAETADTRAYLSEKERAQAGIGEVDPYQNIYNRIANALLAARRRRAPEELAEIREVTQLRFAADLAPEAFGGYLRSDGDGEWEVQRLPAEGDPMLARIQRIRERDYMLVDTLNEHYAGFYEKMDRSYDEWRMYSFDEQIALEEIQRKSRMAKILGGLAILGGLIAEDAPSDLRDAAVIGGTLALKHGIEKGQEAQIHKAALQELAASFNAELEPLLVDVEGQTLRLTGSAETQFAEWRKLLRELLATETGLPADPNAPGAAEGAVRR